MAGTFQLLWLALLTPACSPTIEAAPPNRPAASDVGAARAFERSYDVNYRGTGWYGIAVMRSGSLMVTEDSGPWVDHPTCESKRPRDSDLVYYACRYIG